MFLCSCWAILVQHQLIFNIFSLFWNYFSLMFCHLQLYILQHLLLPFYVPTTLYLNLTIFPSLHLPFILTLLLPIFKIKNVLFSLPFNPYFAQKKGEYSLSLSLSLSLSICVYKYIYSFFWWIFNSLDWWFLCLTLL